MKVIKYLVLLAVSTFILSSCKDNEDLKYDGRHIANFAKTTDIFYVSSETSVYNMVVGLTKPADTDMNVSLTMLKKADNGRLTVAGLQGNKINVTIPRGSSFINIPITARFSDYGANDIDTIIFQIDNPLFGRQGELMLLDSVTTITAKRLCVLTSEELKNSYPGTYVQVGDETYDMEITYIEGDTLLISNFWGDGNDVKFFIDLNVIPYETKIKDNTFLWLDATYGQVIGRNVTRQSQPISGVIDNCTGIISVAFGMQLPDLGASTWFTDPGGFSLKKK